MTRKIILHNYYPKRHKTRDVGQWLKGSKEYEENAPNAYSMGKTVAKKQKSGGEGSDNPFGLGTQAAREWARGYESVR